MSYGPGSGPRTTPKRARLADDNVDERYGQPIAIGTDMGKEPSQAAQIMHVNLDPGQYEKRREDMEMMKRRDPTMTFFPLGSKADHSTRQGDLLFRVLPDQDCCFGLNLSDTVFSVFNGLPTGVKVMFLGVAQAHGPHANDAFDGVRSAWNIAVLVGGTERVLAGPDPVRVGDSVVVCKPYVRNDRGELRSGWIQDNVTETRFIGHVKTHSYGQEGTAGFSRQYISVLHGSSTPAKDSWAERKQKINDMIIGLLTRQEPNWANVAKWTGQSMSVVRNERETLERKFNGEGDVRALLANLDRVKDDEHQEHQAMGGGKALSSTGESQKITVMFTF